MRSVEELASKFKEEGLRMTPQRQVVFEILQSSDGHPSAEAVFAEARAKLPSLSLRTVYQTLHDLERLGEVHVLELGTGQARFDPGVEAAHHHLVCGLCGRVDDLFAELPSLEVEPAAAKGYLVERAEVVFRGVCGSCRHGAGAPAGQAGAGTASVERLRE